MHHVAIQEMRNLSSGVVHLLNMETVPFEEVDMQLPKKLYSICEVLPVSIR